MKRRYQAHLDCYGGLGDRDYDWAVWDTKHQIARHGNPIAVFARRDDARVFAKMKNESCK